jgi:cohesin complex subunit SA-1/2
MATGELDLSVRIQAIQVLRQIETHGLLDEDQRDEIAKLVFETERRVRGAAADFFSALLGEEVEKRETELEAGQTTPKGKGKKKGGAIATFEGKDQLQLKCLAELLVKYGRSLDGLSDEGSDDEEDQADDTLSSRKKEADVVEVKTHRGRVAFAVEALWEQVEAVRDWQAIMDFLLLDHSADSSKEDTPKAKGRKGKGKSGEEAETGGEVLEACRLTEAEETLLVEVLVASLTKVTVASAATTKKVHLYISFALYDR